MAVHINKDTEKKDLQPVFELGTITDSPQLPERYLSIWQPVCIYDTHRQHINLRNQNHNLTLEFQAQAINHLF